MGLMESSCKERSFDRSMIENEKLEVEIALNDLTIF